MAKKKGSKGLAVRRKRTPNTYGVPNPDGRSLVANRQHAASLHGEVVGMVNPFSVQAEGRKIPDDDSTPSFTAQIKQFHTMVSDANGNGATSWEPQPARYNGRSLTLDVNSVVTATSDLPNPDFAAYTAQGQEYRIVSWGVRVYSILPGLTAQGTVRFITSNVNAAVGQDMTGLLQEEIALEPINGLDAYWTSKPTGTTWKEYVGMESFADWTRLFVYIEGAPASSSCLFIEVVYNIEVTPKFGVITATLATPAAPSKPHVLAAASHVHAKKKSQSSSKPSLFASLAGLARDALLDVAGTVIPFAGRSLANAILPSAGPRYPMIVD